MADPNSTWTRLRVRLVRWLDPYPDQGEAWCMSCALNGGRTLILNAAGHKEHALKHIPDKGKTEHAIMMRVNWGYAPEPEDL